MFVYRSGTEWGWCVRHRCSSEALDEDAMGCIRFKKVPFRWSETTIPWPFREKGNYQSGVFLAHTGDKEYGLVDFELYISQEWYNEAFSDLREECHIPDEKKLEVIYE